MTDFIFLGSKIIADGDCSHEIKRHLLLFFNQKNENFTISYNDTNSYNLGLVKCVFCQDLHGNSSQT